jgi:hypothetical protein
MPDLYRVIPIDYSFAIIFSKRLSCPTELGTIGHLAGRNVGQVALSTRELDIVQF